MGAIRAVVGELVMPPSVAIPVPATRLRFAGDPVVGRRADDQSDPMAMIDLITPRVTLDRLRSISLAALASHPEIIQAAPT